jgi:HSP20 family protein
VVGFDKKDVTVKVEDNLLKISGKQEEQDNNRTYIKRERYFGNFERSFNLPKDVKVDAIKAENKNGLLTVTIPYAEQKNKKVNIEIK